MDWIRVRMSSKASIAHSAHSSLHSIKFTSWIKFHFHFSLPGFNPDGGLSVCGRWLNMCVIFYLVWKIFHLDFPHCLCIIRFMITQVSSVHQLLTYICGSNFNFFMDFQSTLGIKCSKCTIWLVLQRFRVETIFSAKTLKTKHFWYQNVATNMTLIAIIIISTIFTFSWRIEYTEETAYNGSVRIEHFHSL